MAAELSEYNRKRDFEKTAEPRGLSGRAGAGDTGGLRFVVQHHMARSDHYDLRLEWDGVLLSWAVPKGPSFDPRDKRLAIRVEDHPLEYRNFEGTIPKGEYGGGTVMLWDEGFWDPRANVGEALKGGSLKLVLYGSRLKGKWALVRLKNKEGEAADNWLFLKEKDEYAKAGGDLSAFDVSVRTGRTMSEIEKGENKKLASNPTDHVDVQLAKPVSSAPDDGGWLYELKYDGYRILAFVEGGAVRLVTRNGSDYTGRFKDIASSLAEWASGRAMILDGEMVVADQKGRTDFQALQSYMKNQKSGQLTYIIFDLLALNGADLRARPLTERKNTLEALMADAPPNLWYSRHVAASGAECLRAACRLGMEGIVGKRADSVYSGTRNGDWIKIKCDNRQEFVIGGYTLSDKKAGGISSLLLGAYAGGELIYAGRAGTGFTERSMKELAAKFESIKRDSPPFKNAPPVRKNERATWLRPEMVAEIKFAEWTADNLLRQASFKGLRTDKNPKEVTMEKEDAKTPPGGEAKEQKEPEGPAKAGTVIISGVRVTSPDKVIFENPQIKKADVVRYYAEVSERMLPCARNRILSIVRCPKGIAESCFYKKHPGPGGRGIITVPVIGSDGETGEYFYIEDATGLVAEAQMGTLEFHVWGSRVDNLERPDMMVFDLDPDEGMALDTVRRGARDIKDILDQLSLRSFLKTSGGKGYHVVVPFEPSASWDVFYDFARRIAELMESKWPDHYTSNVRKDKRKNRIFIDWIRNGRGATSIAPYSLRARDGARVSMPIAWEELDTVAPDGVDMAGALKRIGGLDPWEGFGKAVQRLK